MGVVSMVEIGSWKTRKIYRIRDRKHHISILTIKLCLRSHKKIDVMSPGATSTNPVSARVGEGGKGKR